MIKEKLLEKIDAIQKEYKNVNKYKSLIEVCEPGHTGFVCRKVGTSGYILLCPVVLKPRVKKVITIDDKQLSLEDFMGVHPYIAVVMESSSEQYTPGDVVILDAQNMKHTAQDVVVKSAMAVYVPESCILGIDKNLTL